MKQKPVLDAFMPAGERAAIKHALRGEEREYFKAMLAEMQAVIDTMPVTYETDGQGDEAIAHLHYFRGVCDAWIVELDKGAPDDTPEDYQRQAFGLIDLGDGPEAGYISIPELVAAGLELDLYWKPKTVGAIKESRA